ncbi:MAG: hypothetical protein HWE13_15090 [Gammaproteobacteria bacterium]|nr:hypothetical protein [Gammaproteobacteria bacterium]
MSIEKHLEQLKDLLTAEDLVLFSQLTERLMAVNGDFNQLTEQERQLIVKMEQKYGDPIRNETLNSDTEQLAQQVEQEVAAKPATEVVQDNHRLLKTEFAGYVKDMLLRELGGQFSDLKSAVNFAYEQKWLPAELKNPDVCETLYERFFSDIEQANQWRLELQGEKADLNNKPLAIGLTWFMYIFQLKQWVDSQ